MALLKIKNQAKVSRDRIWNILEIQCLTWNQDFGVLNLCQNTLHNLFAIKEILELNVTLLTQDMIDYIEIDYIEIYQSTWQGWHK